MRITYPGIGKPEHDSISPSNLQKFNAMNLISGFIAAAGDRSLHVRLSIEVDENPVETSHVIQFYANSTSKVLTD